MLRREDPHSEIPVGSILREEAKRQAMKNVSAPRCCFLLQVILFQLRYEAADWVHRSQDAYVCSKLLGNWPTLLMGLFVAL